MNSFIYNALVYHQILTAVVLFVMSAQWHQHSVSFVNKAVGCLNVVLWPIATSYITSVVYSSIAESMTVLKKPWSVQDTGVPIV